MNDPTVCADSRPSETGPYRVLVTGSRDAKNPEPINRVLAVYKARYNGRLELCAGGQRGVDSLAREWAIVNKVPFKAYPVDHDIDGPWPNAGPRRNKRMHDAFKPHEVVAFPGGRGTASMKGIAYRNQTRVTTVS
jgi:hypothetical protein